MDTTRIIRNESEYQEVLAEINRLWGATGTDAYRLELLAMLAHNYERALEPLPPPDPVEAIKFSMEQQGLTRKDLLPVFGTTARVSEILNRKRPLTLEMIRELHARFEIPLESLIERPRAKKAKPAARRAKGRAA